MQWIKNKYDKYSHLSKHCYYLTKGLMIYIIAVNIAFKWLNILLGLYILALSIISTMAWIVSNKHITLLTMVLEKKRKSLSLLHEIIERRVSCHQASMAFMKWIAFHQVSMTFMNKAAFHWVSMAFMKWVAFYQVSTACMNWVAFHWVSKAFLKWVAFHQLSMDLLKWVSFHQVPMTFLKLSTCH